MEDFDRHPDSGLMPSPRKGRGTAANVGHRFAATSRQAEDDGWCREEESAPRTELFTDTAKTVIARNDSPDLPFDQSANPYRGCEHGCVFRRMAKKHFI